MRVASFDANAAAQEHAGYRGKLPSFLDRDVLREYSRVSGWATALCLGREGALLVAAAALCERFRHPLVYVVAAMFIGARQYGIATIALHDGAHFRLCRNRALNDFVAIALCCLLFLDMPGYRAFHGKHHRLLLTKDDPELPLRRKRFGPIKVGVGLLLALVGGGFVAHFIINARTRWLCPIVLVLPLIGYYYDVRIAELWVRYWIVPGVTWLAFLNFVQIQSEHWLVGPDHKRYHENPLYMSRDVAPSLIDRLFFISIGTNYHLTHHIYPAVPVYRLAKVNALLRETPIYKHNATLSRGYFDVIADLVALHR